MAFNSGTKSRDIELWEKWHNSRSDKDLQALIDQMKPIIMREVNKWAPSISKSLLEAEGKKLAVEAFEKFNPNAGAQLSTYLTSRLVKMSRLVYSTQNTARVSETKALLHNVYHTGVNILSEQLGREPSNTELSDHLGWSPKKLNDFQRQALRKEFIESEEHPDDETAQEMDFIDLLYHDLTPVQQKIFDHTTGYQGNSILDGKALMKKLGITQGQLSYQKDLLIKHVEKAKANYHG